MSNRSKSRSLVAFIVSGGAHVAFAMFLFAIPQAVKKHYDTVDMAVTHIKEEKEPEPEPEPEQAEPEPEPEPKPEPKKRVKKAVEPKPEPEPEEAPPPPPPVEEAPPEVKEEAPPVFDLGDNTFAAAGQGASWNMKRSDGNTRFAGVAKKGQPSVRNTKPTGVKGGKPGGTGKAKLMEAPVPLRDLSRRPMPKHGPVPIPPYPPEAKRAGIEGPVVLKVFIDKQGRVKKTQVVQSPDLSLSKTAQAQIAKIEWTPPLDKSGNPVETVIVWRFRFVLDG